MDKGAAKAEGGTPAPRGVIKRWILMPHFDVDAFVTTS